MRDSDESNREKTGTQYDRVLGVKIIKRKKRKGSENVQKKNRKAFLGCLLGCRRER